MAWSPAPPAPCSLSILLTYLFGKSEMFVWVVKWSHNFARVSRVPCSPCVHGACPSRCLEGRQACRGCCVLSFAAHLPHPPSPPPSPLVQATKTALQPVTEALGPPLVLVGQALRVAGGQAWQALAGAHGPGRCHLQAPHFAPAGPCTGHAATLPCLPVRHLMWQPVPLHAAPSPCSRGHDSGRRCSGGACTHRNSAAGGVGRAGGGPAAPVSGAHRDMQTCAACCTCH